ncbi:MAG: hypothetical protein ACI9RU_001853 [Litorivivens sp.]|jgi:hypothetical protein
MKKKLRIASRVFAIVAVCLFTSCEKDVEIIEQEVVTDCPDLELNFLSSNVPG